MAIKPQDKILFSSKIAFKSDTIVESSLAPQMKEERMSIFKHWEKDLLSNLITSSKLLISALLPESALLDIQWAVLSSEVPSHTSKILITISILTCPSVVLTLVTSMNLLLLFKLVFGS